MRHNIRMAATALLATIASVAHAQFTPIATDFSGGVQPFTGAVRDTVNYNSGPSSMRIAHQYTTAKELAAEGAYNGTVVQTNFWVGQGFPTSPVRFYCMLRDLTLGADGHQMDIHLNFGSTDYGYSWLGMHYFNQGAFSSGWEVGMDETIDDIGSLRNPWNGQPTFREKFEELYGSREVKPAVVLSLVIETMKGAICIDDLSVTMAPTPVVPSSHRPTVRMQPRADEGAWRVVMPNGRLTGAPAARVALSHVVRFANGQAHATMLAR
jgi:hypothetical protein